MRITRSEKVTYNINAGYFKESQESALYEAVQTAQGKVSAEPTVENLLSSLLPVIPAINAFFDAVLVMDENQSVRENRLGLLQAVSNLAAGIVDLSKLEGF